MLTVATTCRNRKVVEEFQDKPPLDVQMPAPHNKNIEIFYSKAIIADPFTSSIAFCHRQPTTIAHKHTESRTLPKAETINQSVNMLRVVKDTAQRLDSLRYGRTPTGAEEVCTAA